MNSGASLPGCTQGVIPALRFGDAVPSQEERHDRGPRHPATTPLHGRYLIRPLVDVQGTVYVRLCSPPAGAYVQTPVPPVGSHNLPAGMAGNGRASFIYVISHQNSRQRPFIFKHINQLPIRPGMQPLVQLVSIVNAFPDPVKIPYSYLLYVPPYALRNEVRCSHV